MLGVNRLDAGWNIVKWNAFGWCARITLVKQTIHSWPQKPQIAFSEDNFSFRNSKIKTFLKCSCQRWAICIKGNIHRCQFQWDRLCSILSTLDIWKHSNCKLGVTLLQIKDELISCCSFSCLTPSMLKYKVQASSTKAFLSVSATTSAQ